VGGGRWGTGGGGVCPTQAPKDLLKLHRGQLHINHGEAVGATGRNPDIITTILVRQVHLPTFAQRVALVGAGLYTQLCIDSQGADVPQPSQQCSPGIPGGASQAKAGVVGGGHQLRTG
jgi:hypothetical protein